MLLVLGGVMVFVAVPLAVKSFRDNDRHFGARMVGMFLLPVMAICGGLALAGGTVIHEDRSPSRREAPEGAPETWEEE
jgi:hypothetical protein